MNPNPFHFGEALAGSAVATATIPAGLSTKLALFDALAAGLCFPDYFGRNFDALEECLRDLAWLPPGRVLIVHEGLPLLKSSELTTYLSVLRCALAKWRNVSGRELIVAFPASDKQAVMDQLQ